MKECIKIILLELLMMFDLIKCLPVVRYFYNKPRVSRVFQSKQNSYYYINNFILIFIFVFRPPFYSSFQNLHIIDTH